MRRLTFPRLVALLVALAFLAGLASVDGVAASIALVGGVSGAVALRHRSRASPGVTDADAAPLAEVGLIPISGSW